MARMPLSTSWLIVLLAALWPAWAQGQSGPSQPVKVAERTEYRPGKIPDLTPRPGEHPFAPAVRWAQQGLQHLEQIRDYSCVLIKRERIGGKLQDYQYMYLKVRHRPFSVYMYFLAPKDVKGQEVIYVEGKNGGNLLAHGTGVRHTLFGTVSLKPTGMLAMNGNRYPITEVGILNLTRRLLEVGTMDMQRGEAQFQWFRGARVNNRRCVCMQFVHPKPRKYFRFHIARVFVDEELNVPIRYESYSWPTTSGGKPILLEEYTYTNLKLNNGFTDLDFDVNNPKYNFKKR